MKQITKLIPKFLYIVTLFTIMALMGFTGLYLAVGPDLPAVDSIRQIRLQTPMSVYSKDGQLINEFGDIRRIPITLDQVPQDFINALLSTEDVRFYQHSGVDFKGVIRAVIKLITTGTKSQGASTITMMVAKNYYLTREKRFSRKFTEMFVAWKLESALSKQEILELFLNKIPFGHRSAGLGAAAQVYYGKQLNELDLPQLATLAGIPNGPSIFNPISNPTKAQGRRNHVLGRMLAQNHINQAQFEKANDAPIKTHRHGAKTTVSAPYIAEMVHMDLINRFGRDAAHSDGFKVFTSIDPRLQEYAQQALRKSLLAYDRRHGYRAVEQHYDISNSVLLSAVGLSKAGLIETALIKSELADMLAWIGDFSQIGKLIPALVISTDIDNAEILLANGSHGRVLLKDSLWARKYVDENHREWGKLKDINKIFVVGDVIRVLATGEFERLPVEINKITSASNEEQSQADQQGENSVVKTASEEQLGLSIYLLSQIPDVNGGFVVLNPQDGSVEALVGGFDYQKSKFNMVSQARRQIGSNIKPFIYSAALEKGYTAASLINDSPIIESDISAGNFWRPENASDKYRGPTRLRVGLRYSINTVAIKLIKKFGPKFAKSYLEHIGFPKKRMQPYPSLALGSASFTPLEVATNYAALANGGYQVKSWYIERIEDSHGKILFEQQPVQVCEQCLAVIEAQQTEELQQVLERELEHEQTEVNDELQKSAQIVANEPLQLIIDQQKPIQNLPLLSVKEEQIAPRVIEARNRYIIDSILNDVIHRGTAWRPLFNSKSPLLKRHDIAGKTGTTNEEKDAWFSGYNHRYVASAWVGFRDHSRKLGKKEYGGVAALPIWQNFMENALKGTKEYSLPRPEGIVDVKIDMTNGKLASANTKNSEFEVFRVENVPTEYSEATAVDIMGELDEAIEPQLDQYIDDNDEQTELDIDL